MLIRSLSLLFLILFVNELTSQNTTKVVLYEETPNIENQLKKIKDEATRKRVSAHLLKKRRYFKLYIKDSESLFIQVDDAKDNASNASGNNISIETGNKDSGIYKNLKTNAYLRHTSLFNDEFLIKDELPIYEWKISEEKKNIGGFECKKATTTINGVEISAWFSSKIKTSNGPSDSWGLPGLIIQLNTHKKTYKVIKVLDSTNFDVAQNKPKGSKQSKEVKLKEFNKIRQEKINQIKSGNLKNINLNIGG